MFVVLEGMDCSGKTTLLKRLEKDLWGDQELVEYFKDIVFTFEPGGKDLEYGQAIRNVVFNSESKLHTYTETLLILSNRIEHIQKLLRPTHNKNNLIVCDRYDVSTIVYQFLFAIKNQEHLDSKNLFKKLKEWKFFPLVDFVTKLMKPDLIIFLNIDRETYEERFLKRKSNKKIDKFDVFFNNYEIMKNLYISTIEEYVKNYQKITTLEIDSSFSIEKKSKKILNYLKKYIQDQKNRQK